MVEDHSCKACGAGHAVTPAMHSAGKSKVVGMLEKNADPSARAIRQGSDASSAGHVEYSVVEMETRAVRYGGAIDQSISSRESYDGIIFGGPSRRRDPGARTISVRLLAGAPEDLQQD